MCVCVFVFVFFVFFFFTKVQFPNSTNWCRGVVKEDKRHVLLENNQATCTSSQKTKTQTELPKLMFNTWDRTNIMKIIPTW